MIRSLLTTALCLASAAPAFAANPPPYFTTPPANQQLECDGTNSYANALTQWVNTNAGAVAADESGVAIVTTDFEAVVRTALEDSTLESARAQAAALDAKEASGETITTADLVAAADYLADDCGLIDITIKVWVTDSTGSQIFGNATFKVVDTTAPTMSWTYRGAPVADGGVYTTNQTDLPATAVITAQDLCCGTYLDTRWTWGGATTPPTVTYSGGTFTVTDAAVGTEIILYAKATDECGNAATEEFIIINIDGVKKGRAKLKGNEGLGNGVDPNTPGHAHNGGNDDPQFSPGNPGARYKNRQ